MRWEIAAVLTGYVVANLVRSGRPHARICADRDKGRTGLTRQVSDRRRVTSNSNDRPPQTQTCRCTAESAAACSLADVLREAPLVMQLMDCDAWSAVSACSRQLRQLVQSKTRIVYAPDPADVDLLVKYKRPQLCLVCLGGSTPQVNDVGGTVLRPQHDTLEFETIITVSDSQFEAQVLMVKPTMRQHGDLPACHTHQLHQWAQRRDWNTAALRGMQHSTGMKQMAQLKALGLQHIEQLQIATGHLGEAAIASLVTGDWRHLDVLNLSKNKMDVAPLQLLAQGSWHQLTHLDLSGSKLNEEVLSHLCIAGWPLQKVVLRGTGLTSTGVAILASKLSERLRTLDLADNQLDEVAMEQLVQGKWRKLRSLYLSDNNLNDAAMGHLVKGKWPRLKNLSVKRNCVTLSGLLCLPAAQWPCTELLVVTIKQQGVAAQTELLQDGNASVSIQFDTDLIFFTADKHTTEHVSFSMYTSKYKSDVLNSKAEARHF